MCCTAQDLGLGLQMRRRSHFGVRTRRGQDGCPSRQTFQRSGSVCSWWKGASTHLDPGWGRQVWSSTWVGGRESLSFCAWGWEHVPLPPRASWPQRGCGAVFFVVPPFPPLLEQLLPLGPASRTPFLPFLCQRCGRHPVPRYGVTGNGETGYAVRVQVYVLESRKASSQDVSLSDGGAMEEEG